jgi:hypothetical protein
MHMHNLTDTLLTLNSTLNHSSICTANCACVCMLIRRTSCYAAQGTAMLVDGGRVAAENCVFQSAEMCLGVVMVQNQPAAISMMNCSLQHNMWGAFLGRNLSAESERAVRAVNTFRWNSDEDITRMYEYDEQIVQPWRRSWATAATATTASTNSAATGAGDTAGSSANSSAADTSIKPTATA